MLTLKKIEDSILFMDETYDANFGEWIRNEDNAKVVAYNMKKYADLYRTPDIIVVVKWIVKDWTLKSIIIFAKKMLIEDIRILTNDISKLSREKYYKRLKIVSGLIYTWNPIFISEFVLSSTKYFNLNDRCKFLTNVLEVFDMRKLSDILAQLESKLEPEVREELIKRFNSGRYKDTYKRLRRTESLVNAYNVT